MRPQKSALRPQKKLPCAPPASACREAQGISLEVFVPEALPHQDGHLNRLPFFADRYDVAFDRLSVYTNLLDTA